MLEMPSRLKTIPIKKYSQSGKRTPPWRLAQKCSPPRISKCLYFQRHFWQSTRHFSSLHTFCGNQQGQQFFSQTTILSYVFFQTKQNSTSTVECLRLGLTIQFQNSTHCRFCQRCGFTADWNSKSPGRYVSKSGKIPKQFRLK